MCNSLTCISCKEHNIKCSVERDIELGNEHYCCIERKDAFRRAVEKLKNGEFIQVIAPHSYGKHSFLLQLKSYAEDNGYRTVFLDFFKNPHLQANEIAEFYIQVCKLISDGLNIDYKKCIDKIWNERRAMNDNCNNYIEKAVLRNDRIFILIRGLAALNEVVLGKFYDTIYRWTENSKKLNSKWKLLTVAIAFSPDLQNKIRKINGIGVDNSCRFPDIQLRKFGYTEIDLLADQHELWKSLDKRKNRQKVAKYLDYNPYLVNHSFRFIKKNGYTYRKYIWKAGKITGLFREHFNKLKAKLNTTEAREDLKTIILNRKQPISNSDYLWTLGIVKIEKGKCEVSNKLYKSFCKHVLLKKKEKIIACIIIIIFFILCYLIVVIKKPEDSFYEFLMLLMSTGGISLIIIFFKLFKRN